MNTLITWMPFLLEGFLVNIGISVIAMALATFGGVVLGLGLVSPVKFLSIPCSLVVQMFRNTPWLVILFAALLLLPYEITVAGVLIPVPAWVKAVIGLAIPVAANVAQILRGAIQSIPVGQWEAAEGLGFTRRQIMWSVILPQCIRQMLPPWMNWYAILMLSTPLASVLGVREIVTSTQQAMVSADSNPDLLIPFYGFVLVLFFAFIFPISKLTRRLELKFARSRR